MKIEGGITEVIYLHAWEEMRSNVQVERLNSGKSGKESIEHRFKWVMDIVLEIGRTVLLIAPNFSIYWLYITYQYLC